MDSTPAQVNVLWRKSSYSGNTGGDCVEVAGLPALVAVRDSKNPDHGALTLSPKAYASFIDHVRGPNTV